MGGPVIQVFRSRNRFTNAQGGTLVLTSPAAASVPFTINAHASQSGDLVLIQESGGADRLRYDSSYRLWMLGLGAPSVASPSGHLFEGRWNDSAQHYAGSYRNYHASGTVRLQFLNDTAKGGYLIAGGGSAASPSGIVANKFGIVGSSANVFIYTPAAGEVIQFYPEGTTVKYTFAASLLTLGDAVDIGINATTGTKIGQSTSKIGAYGTTPVVRPAAYTQTYATATRTHAARTAAALTHAVGTADGTVDDVGGAFNQTTLNNNFKELTDQIGKLVTDLANTASVVNQMLDDDQLIGWKQ
jgi:hypothetical protein